LGRVLTRPEQRSFILSAARGYDERVAGAFAAELLAPADGIRQALEALGGRLDDTALEAVARLFGVSPLVIRHQYENQLSDASDATG
jgi:Zn-dependent peptidase ImmA (M78 family)